MLLNLTHSGASTTTPVSFISNSKSLEVFLSGGLNTIEFRLDPMLLTTSLFGYNLNDSYTVIKCSDESRLKLDPKSNDEHVEVDESPLSAQEELVPILLFIL